VETYRQRGVENVFLTVATGGHGRQSQAAHRFAEVSLGILVALAIVAVWREERRLFENRTAK